jgi:hypothetical protein
VRRPPIFASARKPGYPNHSVRRRRTCSMDTIRRYFPADGMLAIAALAAALLAFQAWRPLTAIAAAVLIVLVGLRRGLPLPLALASATAAGSALVHFAVAPEHFAEWWGFGLFFVLSAEVQLGWAVLLKRASGNRMLAVGLVGSLFLVAVWVLSRTSGLPFGPESGVPEEMGVPDLASVVLELVTAGACAWALAVRTRVGVPVAVPVRVLGVALSIALTAWALAAVGAA